MDRIHLNQRFADDRTNALAYELYSTKNNYEIHTTGGKPGRVIVFFSGHGLYYPDTYDEFYKQLVVNNKFEWKKIAQNKRVSVLAEEIIFVRDIYKAWCINGINSSIDTQTKLAIYLKERIGNREVVTVGSSAGGYMAILFGALLHASAIYAMSPQVNLHEYHIDHRIESYNQYISDPGALMYMDLKPLMDSYKGNLFYWYPADCTEDNRQFNTVKSCENVHFFAMDSAEHGATLWGESIIRSLELSAEKLIQLSQKYSGQMIAPAVYCRDTSGFIKTLVIWLGKKIKKLR